jgi:hypothetical protein
MTLILGLFLSCLGVTPGPGWSYPVVVTEEENSSQPYQYIYRDSQGRFHMVWEDMDDHPRIGYKIFLLDGTTFYPETMISRDEHSVYLSKMEMGDSLYAFWRESSPIYDAIRSITDGSEIAPATYLFTTSTLYPDIRACPDSLGRLHVMYDIGAEVWYAVWTPAVGGGFTTDYEWKIEGAEEGGVLLVDGNRVHCVVQDDYYHDYNYIQYDLQGNTVVPLMDFTRDDLWLGRFPELNLDSQGNLMVVEEAEEKYLLWKLDGATGNLLIDEKTIVATITGVMYTSNSFILRPLPGSTSFYLCWTDEAQDNQVLFMVIDEDGNVVFDWQVAYDYSDEDPEGVRNIHGVVDGDGNLYVVYSQVETEPDLGYYPTFGWFDHQYLSAEEETAPVPIPPSDLSLSVNPIREGVVFSVTGRYSGELVVFDLSGREVSSVALADGVGYWDGIGYSGDRLPAGVYTVQGENGLTQRFTLLDH